MSWQPGKRWWERQAAQELCFAWGRARFSNPIRGSFGPYQQPRAARLAAALHKILSPRQMFATDVSSWLRAHPPHPAFSQLGMTGTGSWERTAGSRAGDTSHTGQKRECDHEGSRGSLNRVCTKSMAKTIGKIRARRGGMVLQ